MYKVPTISNTMYESDAQGIVTDSLLSAGLESNRKVREQCIRLIELFSEQDHVAVHQTSGATSVTAQEQKLLHSYLSILRGFNRNAVHRVRQTKHETAEARAEVDALHLHLQNLYYEQRHLRVEISSCESYDHKYLSLPLVPVRDFLKKEPGLVDADASTLMEARINHEHSEREALEQRRQKLLKKKQSLIAENKKRKDDLANLDKDLENFIDAAKPIQKIFEKEY